MLNLCKLGSKKRMDLLKVMLELDVINYDKIINLGGVTSGITYVISHNYAKIKIDSYVFLILEKTLTLVKVLTLSLDKDELHDVYKMNFKDVFKKDLVLNLYAKKNI